MRTEVRMLRRLRWETQDWVDAVNDRPSHNTHRDYQTAQHSPEVWDR